MRFAPKPWPRQLNNAQPREPYSWLYGCAPHFANSWNSISVLLPLSLIVELPQTSIARPQGNATIGFPCNKNPCYKYKCCTSRTIHTCNDCFVENTNGMKPIPLQQKLLMLLHSFFPSESKLREMGSPATIIKLVEAATKPPVIEKAISSFS